MHEEMEQKSDKLKKEEEKVEIGETKPGINLQGYCKNTDCLAAKAKIPVWVNIGFGDISFVSDKTSYCCPDCGQFAIASVVKALVSNSEHLISANDGSVPVKENNYQCFYTIKPGLSYELKANKIRQHSTSLEDLIIRSEAAMQSSELLNLIAELQKYLITVVKPGQVKDKTRLLEKIQYDYKGDYNQVFDIGRFTILCDNPTKLQTAVALLKKAEKFNLIVSEDKDFFERQSKTHHRFHNIKLYVPKHDVYVEMQATLKSFTTFEGYTVIENPKLSHLYYELIRAWRPSDPEEEELRQVSDETLTKINDVICEWIDEKGLQKIADRCKLHSDIGILKPPQLSKKTKTEIDNKVSLKMAQFVYDQLSTFIPATVKGKAIYVILYEYYKKYIIGNKNPASCADFALLLQESRNQEIQEDIAVLQNLETYIPLQANNYPHGDNKQKHDTYDCHQRVLEFLEEEKKNDQKKVMIIQGKSGSGKSIFCRYLEQTLWNNYITDSKKPIPVYISFAKIYNKQNERDIVLQALQGKNISKEIMDAICEQASFVFIMDGFDEIFDFYRQNEDVPYFYDRFNLNQWNAKIVVTCRSNVLSEEDIKITLFGANQNYTSMMYLWPFTKQQMHSYIEKFAKMHSKNYDEKNSDWTPKQYEETLNNYPNLQKMVEEPVLLQLILTVLPSLVKQYGVGSRISRAQVYEVFNDQWVDIHTQNITSKLAELRIQTNFTKIKSALKQYCHDLAFDMFIQGGQIAIEPELQPQNEIWSQLDPKIQTEKKIEERIQTSKKRGAKRSIWKKYFNSGSVDKDEPKKEEDNQHQFIIESTEIKTEDNSSSAKPPDVWEKYFDGDSISKYVLRRSGDNKYQFLHKSCQEYYAAQKIVLDIISWKPSNFNLSNEQFQKQFETHVQKFLVNYKLLNGESGIIKFIGERIHDTNPIYANFKSRLFRILEASKTNENVSVAAANAITILNVVNINMHYRDWNNIKIPHAVLDNAFLEGTDLKNANLNYVSFSQAFLNKADFTNASMNGVYFGEYAYLEGHLRGVNGIQISPDGKFVASCSDDKTIRLWDLSSGKQIQVIEGNSDPVTEVQFSPDGSKIVSCSWDTIARIWDVATGKQSQTLEGHSGDITAVQFSPDGSKILSCSRDKTIRVWDLSSKHSVQILEGHSDFVFGARFSPDGSKIVSCSADKTVRIWDFPSGRKIQIIEGHSARVTVVQFSPDGSKILSCSRDRTIRIWDLETGKQIQSLEGHSADINAARFSSDCSKIVSCSDDRTIRIWDVSSGKQLQVLEGHTGDVTGVQFFPKESKILSCSNDGTIRIWDMSVGRKIQLSEGHLDCVNKVQFSSDGLKIVSCSDDKTIRLWDVLSGRQIQILEGHTNSVIGVQFAPDDSKIVSCSWDKTIRIWDTLSGKQLQVLEGHSQVINGIQFSADGSKVVSYSYDKTIQLWDIPSGRRIQTLKGHSNDITGVQFSPDSSKIVSRSVDKTVRLWDIESGKQLQSVEGWIYIANKMPFSYDGSRIAICSDDKIVIICDTSTGKQLQLLKGHEGRLISVQFVPDNSKIITCSWDNTIRIWDLLSGNQLHMVKVIFDDIVKAQFSPDGSKIISHLGDKTIRIWDSSSGQQILLLEGHTGAICGVSLSRDGSKIVSCSDDRTIRLWSTENEISSVSKTGLVKCIWQVGVQSYGLSMKDSIWENTLGLTPQQKLLVEQRGGKF
ncbi:WD-40 repeat-containing protein [Reticulomyxa filosa]|uniref:WD-40 repeat-containing protein n=1 Tax=Reticulomyxa filosa TaxID=46433 RepID=X6M0D8_RETFI|nr:WD-40 repeat-containing protein [Reticulomyxa filosa]|eukprot:ETO07071.1 WD-40 repeat-containing protein [Reticulomyxa filosa]